MDAYVANGSDIEDQIRAPLKEGEGQAGTFLQFGSPAPLR